MRIFLTILLLAIARHCNCQTTEELMRALDTTDVEASLAREIEELQGTLLSNQRHIYAAQQAQARLRERISALERDARFQLLIEEIEFQKIDPNDLVDAAAAIRPSSVDNLDTIAEDNEDQLVVAKGGVNTLVVHISDTGFCAFQRRFAIMDERFQKSYPRVASLIKHNKLKVELLNWSAAPRHMILAAPVLYPYYSRAGASSARKAVIAEDYLSFIQQQCQTSRCLKPDLYDTCFKLERKKVPDRNVDKLIDLRQQFITHLKTLNHKCDAR